MEEKTVEDFFRAIKEIKKEYDAERNKDRFNVFYALHKWNDEVNLHSRFISYLLCPKSGHGMGNIFAKLFVRDVLNISEDDFSLDGYEVYPNEFSKSEFKEIDILLVNKSKKQEENQDESQAIIIENKIFAKDSNHSGKAEGYNGQLERYYHTIKKGVPVDNREDAKDKTLKKHKYICNTISVFYLSIDKEPSDDSVDVLKEKKDVDINVIYYRKEIVNWLEKCKKVAKDYFQEKIIHQYLILVKNMTNTNYNNEEVLAVKKIITKNENLETAKYIIDNFNHVKWHTAHQFWMKLKEGLKDKNAELYFDGFESFEQAITELTHHNKNINLGVKFSNDKNRFYISASNILSWGVFEEKKWGEFKSIPEIIFSDFSKDNTFRLIDKKNTEEAINDILEEIEKEIKNNFKNLKTTE